jgi:hypothetical protein
MQVPVDFGGRLDDPDSATQQVQAADLERDQLLGRRPE